MTKTTLAVLFTVTLLGGCILYRRMVKRHTEYLDDMFVDVDWDIQ